MHSLSLLCMLKRSLGLYPTHPLWNALPSFNQLFFEIGETWPLGKDTIMYPPAQIIPGVVDRRWIRTLKASQGVWHDQLSNSSLSYCSPGGENCFKQSDKLAVHVDEGLHPQSVGLYVHNPQITMQIKQTLYKAQGGLLFLSMSIAAKI